MTALTGKFPHTHYPRGKKVKVTLRDGTVIIDKFVERRERFVVTENHKLMTKDLKAMSYFKNREQSTNKAD